MGKQHQKVTLHRTSDRGWQQRCSMCSQRLRDGDVILYLGQGQGQRKYHRVCLRKFVEDSYRTVGVQPVEEIEYEIDGVGIATDSELFQAYREKLAEQFEGES